MQKRILWLGLSFLLVAALVLASCGAAEEEGEQEEEEEEEEPPVVGEPSTQEVVDRAMAAMRDVRTIQFEVEVTMMATGEGDEANLTVGGSLNGELDIENKRLRAAVSRTYEVTGEEELKEEDETEMYLIGDKWRWLGYAQEDIPDWGRFWLASETPESGWKRISQVPAQIELLQASEVEIIDSETIEGVECYILQLKPDMERLWHVVRPPDVVGGGAPYIEKERVQEMLRSFSVKQWIAKDTYLLAKAEMEVIMEVPVAALGSLWEEGTRTVKIITKVLAHNYNDKADIVLPPEADQSTFVWAGYFDHELEINILHYDGTEWRPVSTGIVDEDEYCSFDGCYIWGSSASDIFISSHVNFGEDAYLLHYDGNTWSKMDLPASNPRGLWGSSSSDIFGVHRDGILHYDGSTWNVMPGGSDMGLHSVWGSSSSDILALGRKGTILHYDGNEWSQMQSNTEEALFDIWGYTTKDIFAVGWKGTILHYDGNEWSQMQSNTGESLYSVWGTSASDVFAVGYRGTILHYDGSTWSEMDSGIQGEAQYREGATSYTEPYDLLDIWGTSSSNIFAVGGPGTILHYDGNTWNRMSPDIPPTWIIESIWGSSPSDVYATFSRSP